ncbi:hypothetical protein WA026_007036 [Henosepilachna vigintioctopunctata]|uniref:Uncharacterized protein n=1 Tax=Henosepilachna vigintioctopunctata TaxID=420089 RepID=A0AAW1V3J3_9CUCU
MSCLRSPSHSETPCNPDRADTSKVVQACMGARGPSPSDRQSTSNKTFCRGKRRAREKREMGPTARALPSLPRPEPLQGCSKAERCPFARGRSLIPPCSRYSPPYYKPR